VLAVTKAKVQKVRAEFRCAECGWATTKWVGRCGECQAWGTVEEVGVRKATTAAGPVSAPARSIVEVAVDDAHSRPTGVGEFDRVLGGGLIPGGVILLAGEPGVGKSTLLLEVAARTARDGIRTLYLTGEESVSQVRLRADRIGAVNAQLWLAAENDLAGALGQLDAVQPGVVIVDSVQTFASADVEGAAGGVTQVREVAHTMIRAAKERGIATILVGHVTKDGSVAGPRLLEHLVDVVLTFDGDKHNSLRMIRATKNRYGPTDEVGCFELTESGITELTDPSGLFVTRHPEPVPGTCVTVTLEGRRPLVTEVQALVAASTQTNPRRTSTGVDAARVAMVIAVLTQRVKLPFPTCETYAATVGGVQLREPAGDLAVALALASSVSEKAIASDIVAIGEIGLAGEIRPVHGVERRLAEAARLGFGRALIPAYDGRIPDGMRVLTVTDIQSALSTALYDSVQTAR
jgi:DNA repair protein RadA/Sms